MGKMDTILGIPCAHTAKAVAAVVQRFQYLGNLSGGFLLVKGSNHTLSLAAVSYTHLLRDGTVPVFLSGYGCAAVLHAPDQ